MKSTNSKTLQLVSLQLLFYLSELNMDDNTDSSGVCFHIFVCRCKLTLSKFFIFI